MLEEESVMDGPNPTGFRPRKSLISNTPLNSDRGRPPRYALLIPNPTRIRAPSDSNERCTYLGRKGGTRDITISPMEAKGLERTEVGSAAHVQHEQKADNGHSNSGVHLCGNGTELPFIGEEGENKKIEHENFEVGRKGARLEPF